MGKYLYMRVTSDKYELPLIVEDTARALAKRLGIREDTIHNKIHYAKTHGGFTCYKKVLKEENDDDI